MGDIADDMICGLTCSYCGVYFESEHGYPVLCSSCHTNDEDLPKAINEEI